MRPITIAAAIIVVDIRTSRVLILLTIINPETTAAKLIISAL